MFRLMRTFWVVVEERVRKEVFLSISLSQVLLWTLSSNGFED